MYLPKINTRRLRITVLIAPILAAILTNAIQVNSQVVNRILDANTSWQRAQSTNLYLNPSTNRIFVPSELYGGSITAIDGNTNTLLPQISPQPLGINPIDVNTGSGLIYQLDALYGTAIQVVDSATGSYVMGRNIQPPIQGELRGPAVDSVRNRVFVQGLSDWNSPIGPSVPILLVLDGQDLSTLAQIPIGQYQLGWVYYFTYSFGGNGLDVNATTNKIYFPGQLQSDPTLPYALAVIDGSDFTVTHVPLSFIPNGDVTVDEATNKVYLSGYDPEPGGGHVLAVVDGSTNATIAKISLPSVQMLGQVAIDPVHHRLYVQGRGFGFGIGDQGGIALIDTRSNTVMTYFPYGPANCLYNTMHNGAVFNPNNGLVYTAGCNPDDFESLIVDAIDFRTSEITTTGSVSTRADVATISFDSVTSAGTITVNPLSDPAIAGDVPGGFAIAEVGGFEISTTASFAGNVTTCFPVTTEINESDFNNLRILHRELDPGTNQYALVDRTSSHDFTTRTICATTTSFSPFYITSSTKRVRPLFEISRAFRSGSTIPVKLQMVDSAGANLSSSTLPMTIRGLRRIGDSTASDVTDAGNSSPDSTFRYDASLQGYIYNLKTAGLSAGRYVLSFYAGDDKDFFYTVQFEIR